MRERSDHEGPLRRKYWLLCEDLDTRTCLLMDKEEGGKKFLRADGDGFSMRFCDLAMEVNLANMTLIIALP